MLFLWDRLGRYGTLKGAFTCITPSVEVLSMDICSWLFETGRPERPFMKYRRRCVLRISVIIGVQHNIHRRGRARSSILHFFHLNPHTAFSDTSPEQHDCYLGKTCVLLALLGQDLRVTAVLSAWICSLQTQLLLLGNLGQEGSLLMDLSFVTALKDLLECLLQGLMRQPRSKLGPFPTWELAPVNPSSA